VTTVIAVRHSDYYLLVPNDLRSLAFNASEEFLGEIGVGVVAAFFDEKAGSF